MTSAADQQPATDIPANPSATSYASAAGAVKKSTPTPVVATGSSQPVVATGSSTGSNPQHHAKSSSVSPMNGRPNIMPAVPAVSSGAPAVVHGTSSVNGDSHNRTPSVTINNTTSNNSGPNNHTNGGSVATKGGIQFGFQESPAVSHSTPQPASASIPIPGAGANPRVTSPGNSPSPIPQHATSGGRPPSGAQQGNSMTFGSFGGDGDRPHMRTPSMPHDPTSSPHMRRNSSHSHADMNNQPIPPQGGMGRGNFPSAGRGRGGYYNNNNNHQNMGYPPNANFQRGPPNQGRGGMPGNFGNNRQQQFGTPPPPAHRSPALPPAMPQAHNVPPGPMPPYYYQPPPGGPHQQMPQYPYPGQFDPNMRPQMPMHGYPQYPIMHPQGQSPAPNYQQMYAPGPYNPPGGQPMSRNSSQVSTENRPTSSASQNQVPPVAQGTPQPHAAQAKPPVVASPQFARPKRVSAAITIKNAQGEALDLSHLKAPASPAPSSQQSKTPPVIASTPTPPPKSSTPKSFTSAHTRSESTTTKTAEEVRNEFKEKMKQAASADKPKDDEAVKDSPSEDEKSEPEEPQEEEKAKPVEEAKPAPTSDKIPEPKVEEKKEEPPADEEDEVERAIREMEEAEAEREKKEQEHLAKKKIENEAKKKAQDAAKAVSAAENDRKLREAEAEMERLEEEKERKRAEAAAAGKGTSVHDLLKSDKASESATNEATTKLASLSINDKPAPVSGAKTSPSGRGPKPAALNLAPLKVNSVEPPQPSAALQSLKTARLLDVIKTDIYPPGIHSPNPALNAAVAKKGTSFKYDPGFLLQFKGVFTEQPSLDFHQQVKTLIGDGDGGSRSASVRTPAGGSGRQNSRTGGSAFAGIGNFVAPAGGRTLPPGTTSEQRLAMSSGAMARPQVATMGSFPGPRGSFPGGASMSRTSSSANMSNMPNSPRQGSRAGGRNASKQNTFGAKSEAQAAKTMPLTAGMKIESLSTSNTGWKPMSIGKPQAAAQPDGHLDPPTVQRKVKAALNKMTPEKFDRISDQILQIAAQSKNEQDGRTLRQVIQLTFEKATDEAHWASMYAKFCNRMLEMMSPEIRDENITDRRTGEVVSGGALFRKYLLNRCQEEFERGWKSDLAEPKEGEDAKTLEAAMLSEEYYIAAAAKRRGLGLVQFIGELYKLGMLTERIMHECVKKLVDYSGTPDEAEVESLSKLLRTIGGNLDATEKGKLMMDAYFQRIQGMVDIPDLNSRLKFMLMDVIDLRRANWVSKEANKGPKTLEEVRAEAEAAAAQKAAEAARSSQRGPGRGPVGRGDARNYPSGFPQQAPNQIGMDDLRRLKGGANRTSSSNVGTLGPMSMLGSRSNSGRRLGPGGSLSRGPDDSGASSRTGTPPVREQQSTNAFSLLANMDSENPASPPSTSASPALAKAVPETAAKESS